MRSMLVLLGCLVGLPLFVAVCLHFALQHEPHFYRDALDDHGDRQQASSDAMLENITSLLNRLRHDGRWGALFTATQVNGWLAVDLKQNFDGLLPPEIEEPRVRISPGNLTIAARYRYGAVRTIVSLNVELSMPEPGLMALRVHNVRAGAIPIPLSRVLDGLSDAARSMNLHLRWAKTAGDPVALVSMTGLIGKDNHTYRIDALELRNDAIFLAGHTSKATSEPAPAAPRPSMADQDAHSDTTQR